MTKLSRATRSKILGLLRENPNLQRACKKAGIARSTLYRWIGDDVNFRDEVRDAQEVGQDTMNDYVEAKLIENIQANNQRSIEFYLRHNNQKYASTRVESEYFNKRSFGRIEHMPTGTDQMYFSEDMKLIDEIAERLEFRQMLREVKMSTEGYDPDEPVTPEKLGRIFAEEFYGAFPDAKKKIDSQIRKYCAKKMRRKNPNNN